MDDLMHYKCVNHVTYFQNCVILQPVNKSTFTKPSASQLKM